MVDRYLFKSTATAVKDPQGGFVGFERAVLEGNRLNTKPIARLSWPQFLLLLAACVYSLVCTVGVTLWLGCTALRAFLGIWWD